MERAGGDYGKRKNLITKILVTTAFYNLASLDRPHWDNFSKETVLISDIIVTGQLSAVSFVSTRF